MQFEYLIDTEYGGKILDQLKKLKLNNLDGLKSNKAVKIQQYVTQMELSDMRAGSQVMSGVELIRVARKLISSQIFNSVLEK